MLKFIIRDSKDSYVHTAAENADALFFIADEELKDKDLAATLKLLIDSYLNEPDMVGFKMLDSEMTDVISKIKNKIILGELSLDKGNELLERAREASDMAFSAAVIASRL